VGRGRSDLIGQDYMQAVNADMRGALTDGDEFVGVLRAAHESGQALEGVGISVGSEALTYWSTPLAGAPAGVARVEHFYQAGASGRGTPAPQGEGALAGLAAAIPEMVFTAETAGRFTWCNAGAAGTVGYGDKQLLGMALADLVADEDRGKLAELLERALGGDKQVQKAELIMKRAGGATFWGELSLLAGTDASGGGTILQGFLSDVTDRRMARAIREIVSGDRPL
jgi:PAS domain S-box-containing protein